MLYQKTMFVAVAITDLNDASDASNSTVQGPANDSENAHWVSITGVETFAHDEDGLHIIYIDDDIEEALLESVVSVGAGTIEDDG